MRRTFLALVALAMTVGACTGGTAEGPGGAAPDRSPPTTAAPDLPEGPGERSVLRTTSVNCEARQWHWNQPDCLPASSIDLEQIVDGGPGPDGIPPLDAPQFESLEAAARWLEPSSPVMVVELGGEVRAYPLAILTWHEIVNDELAGTPLAITYCPLCNSALVFERTVDGPDGPEVLDFGTSGRLYQSNLLMYDRQHRNLWSQFEGESVVGERFLGTRLKRLPAWLLGFGQAAELHPDATFLSRETGWNRDYGRNPYTGYDRVDGSPGLFLGDPDTTLPPMTRLVGLQRDEAATAILLDHLAQQRVVEVELDGHPVVVLWAPGQSSALDERQIDDGRDVGQTAAFEAELDGQPLDLRPGSQPGRFIDRTTGTVFDLRGRAMSGPLRGNLTPVLHDDSFWFVWVAFRPGTEVVGS